MALFFAMMHSKTSHLPKEILTDLQNKSERFLRSIIKCKSGRVARKVKKRICRVCPESLQKSRQNAPNFNREMNGGLLFFSGYAKI
jgi:hypothetical protein